MKQRGRLYRECLAISREIGYQEGEAESLNCLGGIAEKRGNNSGELEELNKEEKPRLPPLPHTQPKHEYFDIDDL